MVQSEAKAERSRIFISYRREDTEQAVGRLVEDLREHFGAEQVFQDVTSIAPGAEFPDALHRALDTCAAMLVVIGPKWVDAKNSERRRRLDSEDDWVRQEVAESLRRPEVRVFPLLIDASMPTEDDLPVDLKGLARRQALSLTVRHWRYDLAELVEALKKVPGLAKPSSSPVNGGLRFTRRKALGLLVTAVVSSLLLFAVLYRTAPPALVRGLRPSILIGQFYGAPVVLATLDVENTGSSIATISEVRGTLTGPSRSGVVAARSSFTVGPVSWTIISQQGPFAPVVGPFPFGAGMKADLRIVMATDVNVPSLLQRLAELPEYRQQPPCVPREGRVPPLTHAAFEMVRAFAEQRFVWREGDWRLDIDVATEHGAWTFSHRFSLSADEVEFLRQSIALLGQCLAVNVLAPFAQDGGVANFLTK
jgi:hypothetical protein